MKKIIKELYKSWETRKEVLLYEAQMIYETDKVKQTTLLHKLRLIWRQNIEFANKTILKFNW